MGDNCQWEVSIQYQSDSHFYQVAIDIKLQSALVAVKI